MTEVSQIRLHVMRAMYLIIGVGLGLTIWPRIVSHELELPLMNGVVLSMLGTVGVLALLGLRYPLQMLPVLLFELVWKTIWLVAFAFPLWSAGQIDERTGGTVFDTALGAVLLLVIPWRYFIANYFARPADSWRGGRRPDLLGT